MNPLIAMVGASQQGGPGPWLFVIQMAAIFGIFYLLLIRPQRQAARRHQDMLQALKRGDEIMTEGGIIGEVVHIKDDRITIRTGENTRITVARPKIARVFAPGAAEPEKS